MTGVPEGLVSMELGEVTGVPVDERVHRRLLASGPEGPDGTVDDATLADLVRREDPLLGARDVAAAVARVRARIGGVGRIEPLLADPAVSDVLINGPGPVWVERAGRVVRTDVALDRAAIDLLVERVVAPLGLRADRATPVVDARLPDGSRVHVVLPPLAVDGPCVTIRRFAATTLPLSRFCPPPLAELLVWAVQAGWNVVVCGGTGAGKTTLLNALCQHLPPGERVVTVEDAAELRLPGDQVVRLETRPATADGLPAVTVRDLVRAALRMRPDRIVVGEVRGPETLDMLQAMNTGHDGSLSTCHANSPADGLRRLETLSLMSGLDVPLAAVREQIAGAVDLLVQVARQPDGSRRVVAVAEVAPNGGADPARRVRTLADHATVVASPIRPPRRAGPAPGGSAHVSAATAGPEPPASRAAGAGPRPRSGTATGAPTGPVGQDDDPGAVAGGMPESARDGLRAAADRPVTWEDAWEPSAPNTAPTSEALDQPHHRNPSSTHLSALPPSTGAGPRALGLVTPGRSDDIGDETVDGAGTVTDDDRTPCAYGRVVAEGGVVRVVREPASPGSPAVEDAWRRGRGRAVP